MHHKYLYLKNLLKKQWVYQFSRWSKISQFNAHWLMVLASRVRNKLMCTRSMEQWLLKNEKQANDIAYC
jgi:hypothetical protein